jgi:methyl-accepting chemotaxis protein
MLSALQSGVKEAVTTMAVSQERGEQTVQESSVIKVRLSDIHDAVATIQDMGIQTSSAAEEQSIVADGINKNLISIQEIVNQLYEDLKISEKVSSSLSASGAQVNKLVEQFKV